MNSLACQPKLAQESGERKMAEREGFEPPCRLPGKTLSRRPRYDHFGTPPFVGARRLRLLAYGRFTRPPFAASLPSARAAARSQTGTPYVTTIQPALPAPR